MASPQTTRNVIAILTDFGSDSFYNGAMKAAILSVDPTAMIIDVTHSVSPHAITEASFLLARVFDVFAPGTVFLAVVDPGVGGDRSNLIARFAGRTVVAPDNGLISDVMLDQRCTAAFSIRPEDAERIRAHSASGSTFLGRDVLGPVAASLARGEPAESLADPIDEPVRLELPAVDIGDDVLAGNVRYIDAFGNMLTDVSGGHVERAFGKHPRDRIRVRVDDRDEIRGIGDYFSQGRPGELIAIVNSWNLVEIAVNGGSAAEQLGGSTKTRVRIKAV
jgi:S-adenosylmethionine hydrolase